MPAKTPVELRGRDRRDAGRRGAIQLPGGPDVTGGADGATVRNLSGTRDRAGMGTLESVEDGSDPASARRRRNPGSQKRPRGRSQAPGQRGTEEVLPVSVPQAELEFADRHIGPDAADVAAMLDVIGHESLDDLIRATVPAAILRHEDLRPPGGPLRGPGPRGPPGDGRGQHGRFAR